MRAETDKDVVRALGVLSGVWIVAIVCAFGSFERYSSTAGAEGNPGRRTSSGQWELVVAVHPKCPCSRASLRKLADLTQREAGRLSATILLWQPAGNTWPLPVDVPGAKIVTDTEGKFARELGLETSGHAVLYRPDGTMAFSGGLTRSRGSEEPGGGVAAIRKTLAGDPETTRARVFGCSLTARRGDFR